MKDDEYEKKIHDAGKIIASLILSVVGGYCINYVLLQLLGTTIPIFWAFAAGLFVWRQSVGAAIIVYALTIAGAL